MASTTQPPPEDLIPGLPNDIALNCLSRVPRWHQPVLSAVSKPIRSLLSSPDFFTTRSLLNFTENLVYIILEPWFLKSLETQIFYLAFDQKPNLNPTNNNYKKNAFHLVPIPPCPNRLSRSVYATLGSKIYFIGGRQGRQRCSSTTEVWILDCRLHTWERGPDMRLPRIFPGVVVFEGKIYVIGGLKKSDTSSEGAEVFDPAIGRWDVLPNPINPRMNRRIKVRSVNKAHVIGGRIYGITQYNQMVVLDPRTQTWRKQQNVNDRKLLFSVCTTCSVDGILYGCDRGGRIYGFDEIKNEWKQLNMLHKLTGKRRYYNIVNLRGRLLLLGDTIKKDDTTRKFWFAEIEVEKVGEVEFRGKVLWEDELRSLRLEENDNYKKGEFNAFPLSVSL
ncbi:hypothetical protein UlMin_008739 [Ulmus minor]